MSIMVTGGAGFIGRQIIRKLLERGEEVVCFDLNHPQINIHPFRGLMKFYKGDVSQLSQILEAINLYKVHKVIHMAALLPPDTEEKPHYSMLVNIQGTNNVFEASRWTNVQRVVYASSIAVYGTQETYGDRAVTEDDPSAPLNMYGMTKVANEFSASRYTSLYGLDIRGIRICTVFGHGRVTGMTGMIGGLLMSLPAVGKSVEMEFRPEELSPMIHVEDAAEIFVRTSMASKLNHPVYISGGHLATIQDMIDIVMEIIPDASIKTGNKPVPHVYNVDSSRMYQDLGYELVPLQTRIAEHINDARKDAQE